MATKKTSRTAQDAGAAKEVKLATGMQIMHAIGRRKNKRRLANSNHDKKFKADFGQAIDMANCSSHEEAVPFIDALFVRYKKMPASEKSYLYYLKGFSLFHSKRDTLEALKCFDLAINSYSEPEGICYYDRGLAKDELGDAAGRDADFATFVKLRPHMADFVEDWIERQAGQSAE